MRTRRSEDVKSPVHGALLDVVVEMKACSFKLLGLTFVNEHRERLWMFFAETWTSWLDAREAPMLAIPSRCVEWNRETRHRLIYALLGWKQRLQVSLGRNISNVSSLLSP